ncbi:hypothetical protein [Deinococcus cellulosilyticus]|uniref:Uncharacterized protein n=1 Tax=Deinococcus cellulosilyticus (strain DSM 18568 / NBRC 106333 / KACC 11606 / 5516J-15) TaxID=1223518 RepID=A0A511N617_DEIC1|nr:hypothetical protein [Deinococcus cellulosilyticus]GEM48295.1 hypothetical protein DC3_39300 [Deinococcus cellulosilyticus NBRC 106333 = KACC 11606]
MKRSFVWLMVGLLFFGFLADAFAARRTGGGFGRSLRSKPSYSTPYKAPSRPYVAPRTSYNSRYRAPGFPSFIFIPFFGFGHLGYGYSPFSFMGILSLIFNVLILVVVIAFIAWMVRRMRRS